MFFFGETSRRTETMVWNKRHQCHKLKWIVMRSKRGQLLEAKCTEENTFLRSGYGFVKVNAGLYSEISAGLENQGEMPH